MIYSHSSSSIQFYTCHLFSSFSENRISLSLFKHSPILGENILRPVQHESNEHVQLPVVVVQTAKERPASTCLRICNTLSALFLPAKWSKQVVWPRVCSATHAFNRSSRARPRDIDNREPRPSVYVLTWNGLCTTRDNEDMGRGGHLHEEPRTCSSVENSRTVR